MDCWDVSTHNIHQKTGIATFNSFTFDCFSGFFFNSEMYETVVNYRSGQRLLTTFVDLRSCAIRNPMLELVCERSGKHKVPKKKVKHKATGSRKLVSQR